jgi:hypothetical protein
VEQAILCVGPLIDGGTRVKAKGSAGIGCRIRAMVDDGFRFLQPHTSTDQFFGETHQSRIREVFIDRRIRFENVSKMTVMCVASTETTPTNHPTLARCQQVCLESLHGLVQAANLLRRQRVLDDDISEDVKMIAL